ncbi:unnamed protein product [Rhizophagus irregularis]|nr:unnamed protein product [Rhizophagus irregularis]
MKYGHVTDVKPFQMLMIEAYKNNSNFETDELDDYYTSCKTRTKYLNFMKDQIFTLAWMKTVTFGHGSERYPLR